MDPRGRAVRASVRGLDAAYPWRVDDFGSSASAGPKEAIRQSIARSRHAGMRPVGARASTHAQHRFLIRSSFRRWLHVGVREQADGATGGEEPRRAGVPSGSARGRGLRGPRAAAQPALRRREDLRADLRARARRHVPGAVGGRPRRGPDQPRVPRRDEQRDRPVQGRAALPPDRLPRHAQVPGVRAGLQERADDASDGCRQGRFGLRSEGQERRRGDAVRPVVHDRAAAAHRPVHGRAGG
jgi:hypothetical protein